MKEKQENYHHINHRKYSGTFPLMKRSILWEIPTIFSFVHTHTRTHTHTHPIHSCHKNEWECARTDHLCILSSLVAQMVKCLPAMWGTWVRSLVWEDLLEKEMATYSSTLAWKILWTEEPDRLPSMGSQRVGHDWVTSLTHSPMHRNHHRKIGNGIREHAFVI